MPEKIAIVGSRRGADLDAVDGFVRSMWVAQSDTLMISGGAEGVDKLAESLWLGFGGRVWSFRVREISPIKFAIEMWDLGGDEPKCFILTAEPTFADRKSALLYRNSLIAENADRVVAFHRHLRSGGTALTVDFATAYGKHVYEYEAAA